MSDRKIILMASLLIAVLTLIAYAPAMSCGFVWDDDDYVTGNKVLNSLDGLRRIWMEPGATPQYYPVTFTSYWVEKRIWGLDPRGYHAVNILLHAANAVLIGLVLRKLSVPGAWLAAAIFALHPVHVESVAWVTERKNVLSGLFYLLSAWFYLRFAGIGGSGTRNPEFRIQKKNYAASFACFVLALLSKSVTATLPAILLLLVWWKRPKLEWKRDLAPLLPMVILGAAMGVMTLWMEKSNVGAQGADWSLSVTDRVLVAGRALWFYLWKLLWPSALSFNYPRWAVDPTVWWQWVFPAAALGVLAMLWIHRGRLGRAPAVAATFFVVTLLPALGFINFYPMIYSFVADHFQYLASIGLIAAAAATIQNSKFKIQQMGPVVVLLLAVLTWKQAHIYRDLKTLWSDTLRKNPHSWLAHNNLGSLLTEEGNLKLASFHFDRALQLNPRYDNVHYNLGVVFDREGRPEEAISHYREALRLNPSSAQAHNNLGRMLIEQGELELGLVELQRALSVKPDYAKAHNNLGLALVRKEELDQAAIHYEEAIRIEPGFVDPYNNLGVLRARQGNFEAASEQFRRGLKIMPQSAQLHSNLARTLSKRGDLEGARTHYEEALRIQSDLREAQEGLLQARQQLQP